MEQVEERSRAAPRAVGPFDALDLDDPCAREPEQMRAQRTGPQRRQVNDQRTRFGRAYFVTRYFAVILFSSVIGSASPSATGRAAAASATGI